MYYKSILTNMLFFLFTGKERRGKEKSRLSECSMLELFSKFQSYRFKTDHFKRLKVICIGSGKFVRINFQELSSSELVTGTLLYRAGGCLFYINSHGPYHSARSRYNPTASHRTMKMKTETRHLGWGGALRYPQNLDYTFKIYIIVYNTVLLYLYVHFG